MTAVAERWWFAFLLWASLGLVFLLGGIILVWFAMAHIDCAGCATQPKDTALTMYFVAGLGIILVTAIVAAATTDRIPARRVLIPGLGLLLLTLAICFVILLSSLPG